MAETLKPGDTVDYVVTYLEMTGPPTAPTPPRPANLNTALVCADDAPVDYFLYLYRTVGADHEWTDWLEAPEEDLQAFVGNPEVLLYTLIVDGWPGGFFMLDGREPGTCDLAYFGLVPQAIGRGLGRWLLATAVHTGWARPGVERMTVNTNTLDHPRALGLYQRVGFQPIRRVEARRSVTRERTK
ncbi:MAG: GNAT family N-acetyltransferase [Pseudomonadota bacterium]